MKSEPTNADDKPLFGGVRVSGDLLGAADTPEGASVLHVVLSRLVRLLDREQALTLSSAGGLAISEWRILHALATAGPLAQADLVKRIVIEQAQASRVIRSMQLAGTISVNRDTADRRRWICALTPAGAHAFQIAQPLMQARREHIDSSLTAEELAQLLDYVSRVAGRAIGVIGERAADDGKAGTNPPGSTRKRTTKGET